MMRSPRLMRMSLCKLMTRIPGRLFLGRGQNSLKPEQNHVLDDPGVNLVGSPPKMFPIKLGDGRGNLHLQLALGLRRHSSSTRSVCHWAYAVNSLLGPCSMSEASGQCV